MGQIERFVEVPGGELAVIDYGGSGQDVVCVHTISGCSSRWQPLAEQLTDNCHVYAVDLRGHGHSSAEIQHRDQAWQDLPLVAEGLGLKRPVWVATDIACNYIASAAAHHPATSGALVFVNSMLALSYEELKEHAEAYATLIAMPDFRERLGYGAQGLGESERSTFLDRMVETYSNDWIFRNIGARIRPCMERCTPIDEHGVWRRHPSIESFVRMVDVSGDVAILAADFLASITVPVHLARSTLLDDDAWNSSPEFKVARERNWPIHPVSAELHPEITHPADVAAVVKQAVREVATADVS